MKKLFAVLAFCMVCFISSLSAQNTIQSDRIDVRIDNQMDREALNVLTQQLQAQGVYLKVNPRFGSDKKLQAVAFNLYNQDKQLLTALPLTDLRNQGNHVRLIMHKEAEKFVVEAILVNP